MTELSDIDGVGPAMEERLEESGYEDVEAIADADESELSEVDQITSDKALDFIVQAQNLLKESDEEEEEDALDGEEFDLTPSELSDEEEEDNEEDEEDGEEVEEEIVEESDEEDGEEVDDEPELYSLSLSFDTMLEYDVFHAALMRRHERVYSGNQPAADALQKCLDGLDSFEGVVYELTSEELNELHSAVLQQRTNYQGDNLIDHMDALRKVETQVNEQREELLF